MTTQSKLTDEQVALARLLWAADKPLGTIAEIVGCSVYDLSPWIYSDTLREAFGG